jgi:hypothetical protein
MEHKNKEEWAVINDNKSLWSAIEDNNKILSNLYNAILKIENRLDYHQEYLESMGKSNLELQEKMNINLKNIDANIKEIDHDIEGFEKEIDNIKTEVSNTKTTLLENRNIFTCVMDKFMKLENEEIKPKLEMLTNNKNFTPNTFIFPNNEKTIEQNRLWRLYSNNFRQNSQSNNSNIITQMSLLNSEQF